MRYRLNYLSADVNPIGAISKTDLKKFIAYAKDAFDLPVLAKCVWNSFTNKVFLTILCSFLDAVPTAELEPITENYVQADEASLISFSPIQLFISITGGYGYDI